VARLFVAIDLPDFVKDSIRSLQASLDGRIGHQVRWVKPEQCHITLRFFGEVKEDQIETLHHKLLEATSRLSSFQLHLDAIGGFPALRNARVVWVGIQRDVDAARKLQREVQEATAEFGKPTESRPFSPHITVGRPRGDQIRWPAGLPAPALNGTWTVDSITLMQSHLGPAGPRYNARHVYPLRTS
jgi:2'-5' RNA ligase